MAGNVWEWTISLWGEDVFEPAFKYPYNLVDERENLEADNNTLRVVRGGSFSIYQDYARCAYRVGDDPYHRYDALGFRGVVVGSPISTSAL
jgi:gamma-glutamyl hercynylcysteine S-oxide synthase